MMDFKEEAPPGWGPTFRGRVLIQTSRGSAFAQVFLAIRTAEERPFIDLKLSAKGIEEFGYYPSFPKGYEDWLQAADQGVTFALRIARRGDCSVLITMIQGTDVDTFPVVVAAAAADGVWKALGYVPAQSVLDAIDSAISRKLPSLEGF